MTDRIEAAIAEQLAINLADRIANGPRWVTHDELAKCLAEEARAILAALKAARIAVVELPEPTPSNDPAIAGEWLGGEVMAFRDGHMEFDWHSIEPRAARSYARSLLAAELLAAEASQ